MIVIENIDYIGITVSNLDNAIDFYRDLFGFDITERTSNSGFAFIKVGDITLKLIEDSEQAEFGDKKNILSFYVDEEDFDDALKELEEIGVEIVSGPENIRKGRRVIFKDPDGNLIELHYPALNF